MVYFIFTLGHAMLDRDWKSYRQCYEATDYIIRNKEICVDQFPGIFYEFFQEMDNNGIDATSGKTFKYRYFFVKELHRKFPRFVDGALLWNYLPCTPDVDSLLFHQYKINVLDKVYEIYKLCDTKLQFMINQRSLLANLKHFMKNRQFDKCIGFLMGILSMHNV